MDEEVRLDKKAIRAIGSETRIRIMKSLLDRQKTQSELSSELNLSLPTILGHMRQLEKSGLTEPVPEYKERKWKYFRLTKTGRILFEGKRTSIVLLLSYASAALTVGLIFFLFLVPGIVSLLTGTPYEELIFVKPPAGPSSGNGQLEQAMSDLSYTARSLLAVGAMLFLLLSLILFVVHLLLSRNKS